MMSTTASMGRIAAYARWISERMAKKVDGEMQTLKDTWWYQSDTGPAQKCVETTRLPDESVEAFSARHRELVEAEQALCPPIPPPEGGE